MEFNKYLIFLVFELRYRQESFNYMDNVFIFISFYERIIE